VTALGLIQALLLPLLLGAGTLRLLGLRFSSDRLAFPGWAWMTGGLVCATAEGAWLLAGLGTRSPRALSAGLWLLALALFLAGRRVPVVPATPRPAASRAARLCFALALGAVLLILVDRILRWSLDAIYLDDEAHFWAYRAKILFTAGGFGGAYGSEIRAAAHPDYPLLNPLLQLWVYIQAGAVTHAANRVPIQLVTLAVACVLGAGLRGRVSPWVAAALLFSFGGTWPMDSASHRAHSDLMVGLGALVALDAWLRWNEERRGAWLGLCALGTAYLAWAKHEGFLIACAIAAALLWVRLRQAGWRPGRLRPRREDLWCLLPALFLALTWAHNLYFDVRVSHLQGASGGLLERLRATWSTNLLPVLDSLASYSISDSFQAFPAALLVLVLLAPRRTLAGPLGPPLGALVLTLCGMGLVLIATTGDLDWHLDTTAWRLLLEVYPAVCLLVGLCLRDRLAPPEAGRSA